MLDVLDGVELGASRRQRHQGNVGRHDQLGRAVPCGLIENEHGMGPRGARYNQGVHLLVESRGHVNALPIEGIPAIIAPQSFNLMSGVARAFKGYDFVQPA